jgi:alginate O-acetyltransferase complex protein AlgI
MLFNSYSFIFIFAPVTFAGFFLLTSMGREYAVAWLAIASLIFYAWWDPRYLGLLLPSIIINYYAGLALARLAGLRARSVVAAGAVICNLAALFYFKYSTFTMENMRDLLGIDTQIIKVALPVGISFFTFTQIAFIIDAYRGYAREYRFLHYLFFVAYFPHLIAGPIIHHGEIMPQLRNKKFGAFDSIDVLLGLTIFTVGLFKKVIIADTIAPFSNTLFDAAKEGTALTFSEGWMAALLYSFQLYFDFSGYSDMAIGLSLVVGIRLPPNFASPYKARSIIDFWRRWHMTLSRFLRDYLYIPLGGNRSGHARRYINLMVTMVLGGLWHGAAWNFVIWGTLHGIYLLTNYVWNSARARCGNARIFHLKSEISALLASVTTFVVVVFAWVFFRADNLDTAFRITGVMLNPLAGLRPAHHLVPSNVVFTAILICATIVWGMPNTEQWTQQWRPTLSTRSLERVGLYWPRWGYWCPSFGMTVVIAVLLATCILSLSDVSDFIYFNF